MSRSRFSALVIVSMIALLVLSSCSVVLVNEGSRSDSALHLSLRTTADQSVKYVEVNGVQIAYREYGAGEPLLLICGFGATMDNWNATFVSLLAAQYHVFIYDHRGMGYSGDNNATPTITLYADDAVALMHALGYQSMNTYGTSMGSTISQQLVIDHPDAIRKMILSSATYSIKIPECQTLLHILQSVAANTSYPPGVRDEALANLAWNGSWSGLAGIQKPVMLIVGTNDSLTPDSVSVQIAAQIRGSWLVRFQGIQHSGQSYAPIQYASSVIDFLQTDESPVFAPIAPTAPTDLVAVPGNGRIGLAWNASASDGGSNITGYIVYRGSQPIANLNATTLSYVDSRLMSGTIYTYYVIAVNFVGPSAASASVSSVPLSQNPDALSLLIGLCGAAVMVVALLAVAGNRE